MISSVSNSSAALRDAMDRYAGRTESITRIPEAPPEDERAIPPPEENPSARQSHARHSDKSPGNFRPVSEAPRTSDMSRELADRAQAEADAKANIAVIRASDDTVGTLLDITA